MWAKYGGLITQRTNFNDPKTKQPPTINLYNSTTHGTALTNRGNTLDSLLKRGLHLAVCQVSTRGNAGTIAMATGATADAVYNELVANLVSRNAHMVPAGIVAVNRAQERGYSLVSRRLITVPVVAPHDAADVGADDMARQRLERVLGASKVSGPLGLGMGREDESPGIVNGRKIRALSCR